MKLSHLLLPLTLIFLLTAGGCQLGDSQSDSSDLQEPARSIQIDGEAYLPLTDALKGTAVSGRLEKGVLYLSESGLEAILHPGEAYLYRRDYITAVLPAPFVLRDGEGYLPKSFCQAFLGDGTLFDNLLFFRDEVSAAFRVPDSEQGQKLLAALELPRSMGIETRNLDIGRVFTEQPLSEYPKALAAELGEMGFANPQDYTYSEYVVLTEARTVEEAGLSSSFLRNEALSEEDPAAWTVGEYKDWQEADRLAKVEDGLTPEEKAFLAEKSIRLEDLRYLQKTFYNAYMRRSDDELRSVIEKAYQMKLSFVVDNSVF